jgi:hypothetical protein
MDRISIDISVGDGYLHRMETVTPRALATGHGKKSFRGGTGLRFRHDALSRIASIALAAFTVMLIASCQNPDPIAREKGRTLTPDERYLAEYYMKIDELRTNLHDNPALFEEKRARLESEIDTARVNRTIASLERDPERWLAIYSRINELQHRADRSDSTSRY